MTEEEQPSPTVDLDMHARIYDKLRQEGYVDDQYFELNLKNLAQKIIKDVDSALDNELSVVQKITKLAERMEFDDGYFQRDFERDVLKTLQDAELEYQKKTLKEGWKYLEECGLLNDLPPQPEPLDKPIREMHMSDKAASYQLAKQLCFAAEKEFSNEDYPENRQRIIKLMHDAIEGCNLNYSGVMADLDDLIETLAKYENCNIPWDDVVGYMQKNYKEQWQKYTSDNVENVPTDKKEYWTLDDLKQAQDANDQLAARESLKFIVGELYEDGFGDISQFMGINHHCNSERNHIFIAIGAGGKLDYHTKYGQYHLDQKSKNDIVCKHVPKPKKHESVYWIGAYRKSDGEIVIVKELREINQILKNPFIKD